MQNKNSLIWFMIIGIPITLGMFVYVFIITFLYNPIKYKVNEGVFSKSVDQTLSATYTSISNFGFYASLDFELTNGKVDWEIVNHENETIYIGYVIYENGKVFRELTYSSSPFNGEYLNNKEEVKMKLIKMGE